MFDTSPLNRAWKTPEVAHLVRLLQQILTQQTFDLRSPLVLRNHGSAEAIHITSDGHDHSRLIKATDVSGHVLALNHGQSQGIVASDLVPDPRYNIPSTQALLQEGIPVITGWAEALAGLQRSTDTEHAPAAADKFTREGQVTWLVRQPAKWHVLRATVLAIDDDTLSCSIVPNGKVVAETITVAKPCSLRRSVWDGVTVDGITYTYSDSQHRSADDGGYMPVDQIIDPPYVIGGPCPHIYVAWVGNSTDITDVGWLDLNTDARHWVPV